MNMTAKVYVAYVDSASQFYLAVDYVEGMTAIDAVERSGLKDLTTLPEPLSLGVFGQKVSHSRQRLSVGDRVEIYRPLTINPKDIRRHRAAKNPVGRYAKGNRLKPKV